MMSTHNYLPGDILVVEQATMVGSIIVSTARELKMPRVRLATSIRAAEQLLEHYPFNGLILSLNDEPAALALMQNLRSGSYKTLSNVPVAVTTTACSADLANVLRSFLVCRILLKPFKVRDVILTIRMLTGVPLDA